MKDNISKKVSALGNDVLYISRRPWMAENGEYRWWDYLRRPPMDENALAAIQKSISGISNATISYTSSFKVKYIEQEVDGVVGYGVTDNFDKIQNVEIQNGRYLTPSEIDGGVYSAVIGNDVWNNLFPGGADPIGKVINFSGRKFTVVGVVKKSGANMAGFNFDNSVIYSFNIAKELNDTRSLDWDNDPVIMIKVRDKQMIEDIHDEVEGALRRERKVKPGDKDDFSINQLSQVSQRLDSIFAVIDFIGIIIGGFSLLVGSFGIANIMFVTVKERTKIIGLKKAIGARSRAILTEFLAEAVALCVMGGLIGIAIVLILSLGLTYGLDFHVTLSLKNFLLGVSISAAVGVLAGYIPARSASRLDPVVAIRSN
jgi:putative ABC transport system permease protein